MEENIDLSLEELLDCIKDKRKLEDLKDKSYNSSQLNNNEDFEPLIKWFKD